jgi:phosphoglycerol transferase MdoB-like AlkP superfamily enzyme
MGEKKITLAALFGSPENRVFLNGVVAYAFFLFFVVPVLTGLFLPDWFSLTEQPYAALPSRLILLLATGGASFAIVVIPLLLLARTGLLLRAYVFSLFPIFFVCMAAQVVIYREFGTEIDSHVLGLFQGNISALWRFARSEYYADWLLVVVILLSVGIYHWLGRNSWRPRSPRLWPCIGMTSMVMTAGSLMLALQLSIARTEHYHPSKMATAPLYQSVYFLGEHLIANQSTGYREILESAGEFSKEEDFDELVDRLGMEPEKFIRQTVTHPEWLKRKPSHVFFFVMESFGYDLLERPELENVAPNIRRFAKEGLLTPNFFASSGITIDAIHASISGAATQANYPVPRALSQYKLDTLPKVMERAGYSSVFLAASRREFGSKGDSCEAYGYRSFLGCPDVAPEIRANEWGVCDGDFFKWARVQIDRMGQAETPRFVTFLNVSNHSPYDAPLGELGDNVVFPEQAIGHFVGRDREEKVRFAKHVKYADWKMAEMVESLRRDYPDALFVFVGDHSSHKLRAGRAMSVPFVLWSDRVIDINVDSSGWFGAHMDILASLANLVLPEGESFSTLGKAVWDRSSDRVASAGPSMVTKQGCFSKVGETKILFSISDAGSGEAMDLRQSLRKCSAIDALSWGYLNGVPLFASSSKLENWDQAEEE